MAATIGCRRSGSLAPQSGRPLVREVACRLQRLEQTGRAWEWCDNSFYPYDGFRPFPYEEYSAPWFNGNHYSLRGGSLHTRPAIRRPSFRNFYQPDKRHIFAGLRLVY